MMKIPATILEKYTIEIKQLLSEHPYYTKAYVADIAKQKDQKVKDIDLRYRWDLFWFASSAMRKRGEHVDIYGLGCDDSHIDTMLRSIMRDLGELVK